MTDWTRTKRHLPAKGQRSTPRGPDAGPGSRPLTHPPEDSPMARKAQLVVSAPTHQIVSLEQAKIVRQYARIADLKRELKALEGEARPAALALAEPGDRDD